MAMNLLVLLKGSCMSLGTSSKLKSGTSGGLKSPSSSSPPGREIGKYLFTRWPFASVSLKIQD